MDSPLESVMGLLNGYRLSQAVSVATRLGIPDLLAGGPKTPEELAALTSAKADRLYQLLRVTASHGVFVEDESGRFANTPMSECLAAGAPGPARNTALLIGEVFYSIFTELMHSVRTGTPAFDKVFGQPFFDYVATKPDLGRLFDAHMTTLYQRQMSPLVDAYDFSTAGRILDVGGGRGTVIRTLIARFPDIECGLFDLPTVADRARQSFAADGLSDRCTIESGSFFEAVPSGYDTYLLKHVLHDWDDTECVVILDAVRRAIGNDGRLLVLEQIVPDGNEPSMSKEWDIAMLALLAGKERKETEYRNLLAQSRFDLVRVIDTGAQLNVMEARPI